MSTQGDEHADAGRSSGRPAGVTGRVALVDAREPRGLELAVNRLVEEGYALALCSTRPGERLGELQRGLEDRGVRCVVYEISLDDDWDCELVLQSVSVCLGDLAVVVDRTGTMTRVDEAEEITGRSLRGLLGLR